MRKRGHVAFGRGGWEFIDGVPHQRWHLFVGSRHWLWRTKRGRRALSVLYRGVLPLNGGRA